MATNFDHDPTFHPQGNNMATPNIPLPQAAYAMAPGDPFEHPRIPVGSAQVGSRPKAQIYDDVAGLTQQKKPATVSTPSVESTLKERGNRYGTFNGHALVTQQLKAIIKNQLYARNKVLPVEQQEALDMICHKIGRIVNGDNNYADSWHDIAGYAQLVDDILNGKNP